MRALSNEFKQALLDGDHSYLTRVVVQLQNGTTLEFDNSRIWSGGFTIEDAVSEDDSFTALGSVISNSATIIINNIDDRYSRYNFSMARVTCFAGKEFPYGTGTRLEEIRFGLYVVDDFAYNGGQIVLNLLDYLIFLDKPYSLSALSYPNSLLAIMLDASGFCGVPLRTDNIPSSVITLATNFTVRKRPDGESNTFRDVIGWCAAILGYFIKADAYGRLELKWFDQKTLANIYNNLDGGWFDTWEESQYESGDVVDAGQFNPWEHPIIFDSGNFDVPTNYHMITDLYSQDIGITDIVITGIQAVVETDDETKTYIAGESDAFVIRLENNPFITTSNAQSIVNRLSKQLVGLTFRNLNVTHLDNPAIEAGDVALVVDRKSHIYPTLVTRTVFSVGELQTTVSGAETPSYNNSTQYSQATKSYVKARELVTIEKTLREQAIDNLTNLVRESGGLFMTAEQQPGGGVIYYMHNLPTLEETIENQGIIWTLTEQAFTISTDGGQTTSYGLSATGDTIMNTLYARGINADNITITGTIESAGGGAKWDLDTGTIITTDGIDRLELFESSITGHGDDNGNDYLSGWLDLSANYVEDFPVYYVVLGADWGLRLQVDYIVLEPRLAGEHSDYLAIEMSNCDVDLRHGGSIAASVKDITITSGRSVLTVQNNAFSLLNAKIVEGPANNRLEIINSRIEGFRDEADGTRRGWIDFGATYDGEHYSNITYCPEIGSPNCIILNAQSLYLRHPSSSASAEHVIEFERNLEFWSQEKAVEFSCDVRFIGLTTASGTNLVVNSNGWLYKTSSSARYKDIFAELTASDVEDYYGIEVRWARYKTEYLEKDDPWNGKTMPMFIAENVEKYLPEAVVYDADGQVEDWNPRVIIPTMFQMLKSQKEEIEMLKTELAELKKYIKQEAK